MFVRRPDLLESLRLSQSSQYAFQQHNFQSDRRLLVVLSCQEREREREKLRFTGRHALMLISKVKGGIKRQENWTTELTLNSRMIYTWQ